MPPYPYKITSDFKSMNERTCGSHFEVNVPYDYQDFKCMITNRKKNEYIKQSAESKTYYSCDCLPLPQEQTTLLFIFSKPNIKKQKQITVHTCLECLEKECEYKVGIREDCYFTDEEWEMVLLDLEGGTLRKFHSESQREDVNIYN